MLTEKGGEVGVTEREQAILWLNSFIKNKEPMTLIPKQLIRLMHDALTKEQEAVPVDTKVIGTFNGDMEVYCCRDCRTILDPAFHYCPNCGQAVKWE